MTLYPQLILDALKNVRYPGTGKDLVEMGMVEDNIRIDGMNVTFSLLFEKPNDPFIRSVVKAAETAILTYVSPEVNIKGNITVKARQLARPEPDKLLPQVKNIIAVSSGKGGVGKTSTVINLMSEFTARGKKVLAVDLDAQRNLTTFCGVREPEKTVIDWLTLKGEFDEIAQKKKYGDLIPADRALETELLRFASMPAFVIRIRDLLSNIPQHRQARLRRSDKISLLRLPALY